MMKMIHKRVLLLGCFLFSIACLHAQYEYQPFVKEGKIWSVYGCYDNEAVHEFQYLMQGDTIIDGEIMKKIHLIDEYHFHDNNLHYIGAVKEADRRVYIIYDGRNSPMLIYDFMKSSSVINYDDNFAFKIDGRYLYQVNSTLRYEQSGHRHYSSGAPEALGQTFINYEGIGCVFGFDPFLYNLNSSYRYLGNLVMTCYEDGACIYFNGDLGAFYETDSTYVSLLKHRRSWNSHDAISGKDVIQIVLGDTIIYNGPNKSNGSLYRKIYCVESQKYGDTDFHYYGAMREEGKKVFLIHDGNGKYDRVLLFDFGLKTGEQVEVAGSTVKVVRTDYIVSEGRKYHRLTLHQIERGKDTGRTCYWTEGIGSDSGLLQSLPWDAVDKLQLVVTDEDNCIYNNSTVVLEINIPYVETKEMSTNDIYDLQGRRLTQQPHKGVYIQNGRKMVVK